MDKGMFWNMSLPVLALVGLAVAMLAILAVTFVITVLFWTDPVIVLESFTRFLIIPFWPISSYLLHKELNG